MSVFVYCGIRKEKNAGLFFKAVESFLKSRNLYHPMLKTLDISNYEVS